MALYDQLSGTMSEYSSYGTRANVKAVERSYLDDLYRVKAEQRSAMFGTLAQLLGIGTNIWERYSSNREIIKTAQKHGFEPTSSKFNRIFGTDLKFSRDGQAFDTKDVMAVDYYKDYLSQKNLLDTVFGGF